MRHEVIIFNKQNNENILFIKLHILYLPPESLF